MLQVTDHWRERGANALPKAQRDEFVLASFEVLTQGSVAQRARIPTATAHPPKTQSRPKQTDAKNLLDALLTRAEHVLAFLDALSVPFPNHLAERDVRMMTVQHKISGTFRREKGATAFCPIRRSLSTMRPQGRSLLAAMAAVFEGSPFPLAWEPGT